MTAKPVLTLVGCGKMGSAMLRGWISAAIARKIYVIEPNGLPDEFKNEVELLTGTLPDCDAVILAVKPQGLSEACQSLHPADNSLILSIAAGQKIAFFEKAFGAAQPVIRAMPNTPAAIGQGITVAIANAHVTASQRAIADALLRSIGQVEWIANEAWMDAVTALSGSGPAYVFYLIEVLAKAGEAAGLEPALSMRLARQTVIGSAALADSDPEVPAAILRRNVTSPGGTTEAALKVLMGHNALADLFETAIRTATQRSRDLSG